MPTDSSDRMVVHMIWTRDIDSALAFGRLQVARMVREALFARYDVRESILHSLAGRPSLKRAARAVGELVRKALRGRALPLQCLLYADPGDCDRVIAEIAGDVRAVYVDGVRCTVFLERLRAARPELAVITDLDDLMSRRMSLLLELGQTPSTGYLKGKMPGLVETMLHSQTVSRAILRYERSALRPAERDIVAWSDRAVLISSTDAAVLSAGLPGAAKVSGIAPPTRIVRDPAPLGPGPLRFVFIGSDTLRQNELTIDAMVALWARHGIRTPFAIYGDQQRGIPLPANVSMPGYAPTIYDVYDGQSILLSPSYLAGGLKTKVIEAYGYGAAVIGNAVTFEGIDIGDYPLLIEDEATLVALLKDPDAQRDRIDAAARHGAALVRAQHDPETFAARWHGLFDAAILDRSIQAPAIA